MTEHVPPRVYIELGRAGLTEQEAHTLISDASYEASKVPGMGATGRVPIRGTKRFLVYDSGMDGMDWKVRIEDAPVKSADELVREAVNILREHANREMLSYGGPNFYEWKQDALRYLNSKG